MAASWLKKPSWRVSWPSSWPFWSHFYSESRLESVLNHLGGALGASWCILGSKNVSTETCLCKGTGSALLLSCFPLACLLVCLCLVSGASWARLGSVLGRLGGILERPGRAFGPCWGRWVVISSFLARLGCALGASWRRLVAILARLGRVLGASWRVLARLGRILVRLGRDFDASCSHLGRS